ncbi:MAG: hypothetical protein HRU15_17025 [Planctomycetes bacterium]|nr:hypothetical protein [Planctomycetota bacterium]
MAIEIDSEHGKAWEMQGDLHLLSMKFSQAHDDYIMALDYEDTPTARKGLKLSTWMIDHKKMNNGVGPDGLRHMHTTYLEDGRNTEALVILSQMNSEVADQFKTWKNILEKLKTEGKIDYRLRIDKESGLLSLELRKYGMSNLRLLAGMPVASLYISNTEINDLSGVEAMPLRRLTIINTKIRSLDLLKNAKLEYLYLDRTEVSDISILENMPLNWLHIPYSKVKDLSPLKGMAIKYLNIASMKTYSLQSIKDLPLEYLNIANIKVKSIQPLKGMPLQELHMSNTGIDGISILAQMPLRRLYLSSLKIEDLQAIQHLPIEDLTLRYFSNLKDLKILSSMDYVEKLNLSGSVKISDLSPLLKMKNLKDVVLMGNDCDPSALRNMKGLKKIGYASNKMMPVKEFWEKWDSK